MENRLRSRSRPWLALTGSGLAIASLLLVVCLARSSSAVARQTSSEDVLSVQAAIEAGNRMYLAALKDRDARRFASLFTDDAISLPPSGPVIRGRSNIEASISAAFSRVSFLDGSTHSLELQLSSGQAVEIGIYRYEIVTDGVPEELRGRYLTMWRLIHGTWKIAVDSSQPDAPVAEPVRRIEPSGATLPLPTPTATGI